MFNKEFIRFFQNKENQLAIILLLTLSLYVNTFHNEFVLDDLQFIVDWEDVKSLKNIPSFFKGSEPFGHEMIYRPLQSLSLALNYQLWGLNPTGYHLFSIFVQLACTLLVYLIVLKITKKNLIAFMAGLLFGIHPIHTESITFISLSFASMGHIFFFSAFYLYLKFKAGKYRNKHLLLGSVAFAMLAFFTYETTLVLPLLIILYDFCFTKPKAKRLVQRLKIYSYYVMGAISYLFIKLVVLGIGQKGESLINNPYFMTLTMTKVLLKYMELVVFPIKLCFNHTISKGILSYKREVFNEGLSTQSFINFEVFASIILVISLLIIAIKFYKKRPLISFCIGWFFIGLSPFANIIPQSNFMAERYLYIPSFGFCLLFSFLIYHAYKLLSKKYKKQNLIVLFVIFFITIITLYAMLTIDRNKDWENANTIVISTLEQSPESPSFITSLGVIYYNQGDTENAINQYKKALELNPDTFVTYNNLGLIYHKQGKYDLAIEEYKKALEIRPDFIGAHNNLGVIYYNQGKLDLAIKEYETVLKINPEFTLARNNLNKAYNKKNS